MSWTHEQLCERARRWLAGSRKCRPVFSNIGSCREIPDAIGWSSCYKFPGSTVIECKTSREDFRADKKKRIAWRDPKFGFEYPGSRIPFKEAAAQGYERLTIPVMGDYRFYMCPIGVISKEMIDEDAPDHGLLIVDGRAVWKYIDAPRRTVDVNKDAEIRYLRFAIINGKQEFDATGLPFLEGDNGCSIFERLT